MTLTTGQKRSNMASFKAGLWGSFRDWGPALWCPHPPRTLPWGGLGDGLPLCVNSRRSLSLSFKDLGSLQPWGVYNRSSVFPELLGAPCPKLPPRTSGLIVPESHVDSPRSPSWVPTLAGQPPLTPPCTGGSPCLLLMAPGRLVALMLLTPHPATLKRHPPISSHPEHPSKRPAPRNPGPPWQVLLGKDITICSSAAGPSTHWPTCLAHPEVCIIPFRPPRSPGDRCYHPISQIGELRHREVMKPAC